MGIFVAAAKVARLVLALVETMGGDMADE